MGEWMVFDVGNSGVKCGLFDGEKLLRTFHLPLGNDGLVSSLESEMPERLERTGLASVVPEATGQLTKFLSARGFPPVIVRSSMRLPFEMGYHTPESLGADRLAAAAAAWVQFGRIDRRSVVAIDAGTAVTFDVVDHEAVYRGGTISPGPALMQRSLYTETAQLPDVAMTMPAGPIGTTTETAMQAGVMYGFIEGARGLLHRIRETLDDDPVIVATGGWRGLLREHIGEVHECDAHLVLRGIRLLMTLNT